MDYQQIQSLATQIYHATLELEAEAEDRDAQGVRRYVAELGSALRELEAAAAD